MGIGFANEDKKLEDEQTIQFCQQQKQLDKYVQLDLLFPNDPVMPILSNQKMNAYLKEIADHCGITKQLSYHIARHTFVTIITVMNGVLIESVSKMLV